jgi:hypothetical protein
VLARDSRRPGGLPNDARPSTFLPAMAAAARTTIALATSADFPGLAPDDRPLAEALERRGLRPVPAVWSDPAESWNAHAAVIIRSCWDYHLRFAEFERWLDRLERDAVRVFNGVPTIRWNMRKSYLRDLEAAGVAVAGTYWAPIGSTVTLAEIGVSMGWTTMVVKPTVSSTGWETWLVERAGPADEARFRRQIREREMMVQRFLPGILDGEVSLVFFGGAFSHAVRKRASRGEFRVHEEYGGTVEREEPGAALLRDAARAIAAAPLSEPFLYARVDGVVTSGALTVTELELIEPKLYFGWCEKAADVLAAQLAAHLGVRS